MKKFLFSALGAGLLLTSCQSDEPIINGLGQEQQVAFTVSLPDAVSTRAGGTNSAAGGVSNNVGADVTFNVALYLGDKLVYAHNQTVKSTVNQTTATFEPTLVIGEQYRVVAYAEFEKDVVATGQGEEPYTNMGLIDIESGINNEKNDEYFVSTTLTAAPELSAELKRPYGKLRLVAEDLHEAERQFGSTIESVEVTYKYTRPTNFNVIAGTFDPAYTEAAQTFTAAYGKYTNETDAARTIFVDYIPGKYDGSESMMPFTVTVKFEGGKTYTRDFRQDIPVKRNHLTTLKGRLFTIDSDLKLTIEEGFEGETMLDYVTTAKELQQTIDAAEAGTTTICLGANITGDVTILQKEGVNIVIDGLGSKWDGTATINGNARANGAETLTFKNINFETNSAKTFIDAPTKINNRYNYSHNVTVENCTFSSESYNESIVGVKLLTTYNAAIKGCTAKNIHSLVQFQSTDNAAVIENVKVENCKNGISLGNIASATITNAKISANGYGVRLDGAKEREVAVTISGAEINAFIPVNVRKMNNDACKATVKLEGTNTLDGDTYEIAFCSNEYEEGVAPEAPKGTFTLDGADDFKVYPAMPVAKIGNTEYTSIDEAIANWTNGTTLTLVKNVTLSDVVTLKSTEHHILNLGTYTMTAASGKNAFVIKACGTGDSERSAITITADATTPGGINAGKKCIVYYNYAEGGISGNDRPIIKIEGGVFTGSTSSIGSTAGIYFKGGSAARQAATLNISGGTFNCSINGQSKSKLLISGGTFNYSVGSQGDSTALRLIWGGKFKTLGFMTADSNNTKFWFGTSMGNSNVGLYIDDDNYLVVGGPVITEFGDKFAAKATNPTKWSSYLQYSSAAANGLYYTNAELAIKKHGEANVVLK